MIQVCPFHHQVQQFRQMIEEKVRRIQSIVDRLALYQMEVPEQAPSGPSVRNAPLITTHNPIDLFYAYSHKDEALRDELEKHLSPLRRQGFISNWHDRKIGAGTEWKSQI